MMENNEKNNDLTQEILHGLEKAYQELVKFKRYKNSPLVVEKNGVIGALNSDGSVYTKASSRRTACSRKATA